jgi:hypothetical protein
MKKFPLRAVRFSCLVELATGTALLLAAMKPSLLHALRKRMTSLQIHRCCFVEDQ